MPRTPEDEARERIDAQLTACGWLVQDRAAADITAAPGVAIREFPLAGGDEADYLLYADGKAIAVIEAKPAGHPLTGVETQSAKYVQGLPTSLPAYHRPLPFSYESTGRETRFTNRLEPHHRSREVFAFHRPETLIEWTTSPAQLRGALRSLPPLAAGHLWPVQQQAITSLERSLADNRPRALIQMSTGRVSSKPPASRRDGMNLAQHEMLGTPLARACWCGNPSRTPFPGTLPALYLPPQSRPSASSIRIRSWSTRTSRPWLTA